MKKNIIHNIVINTFIMLFTQSIYALEFGCQEIAIKDYSFDGQGRLQNSHPANKYTIRMRLDNGLSATYINGKILSINQLPLNTLRNVPTEKVSCVTLMSQSSIVIALNTISTEVTSLKEEIRNSRLSNETAIDELQKQIAILQAQQANVLLITLEGLSERINQLEEGPDKEGLKNNIIELRKLIQQLLNPHTVENK